MASYILMYVMYLTYSKLGLFFLQLSNEIIRRCCKEINLEKIFDGYVQTGIKSLKECIECCEQWKDIYNKVIPF